MKTIRMRLVVVIIIFLGSAAQAQQKLLVVSFRESTTQETVENINFQISNTISRKIVGSTDGVFSISAGDSLLRIRVDDPSYMRLDTTIVLTDFLRSKKRSLALELVVRFNGQFVEGIDVSAMYKPQIIFSSDTLHVEDFELVDANTYIILTYPKKLEKGCRLIYLQNDELLAELNVPTEVVALELIKDYRGVVYLKSKEALHHIKYTDERLALFQIDKAYYEKNVQPIHDTIESNFYMSNFSEWYPAFEYYGVDVTDTSVQEMIKIEDALMMELYRAEYKWADVRAKLWAWDMESETGIDREIWIGANYFTRSLYYEPLYAPIFVLSDSVLVFDFYNDSLFLFDGYTYQKEDAVPIRFHHLPKKSGWEKGMIQDRVNGAIYNIYDKAGYAKLREIRLPSVTEGEELPLHYRYCEKIKVYDGYAYYTYRPFESPQKKFLYREKLSECKTRE